MDSSSRGDAQQENESKGRSCLQEDGGLSNCQSENSGRSSFHPFVCLQAVFSPVKTKFNLHPFTHCFSLPPPFTSPHPFAKTILSFKPAFPFFFLSSSSPYLFFLLSHNPSVTSSATQKARLHFDGLGHSCLSEHSPLKLQLPQ